MTKEAGLLEYIFEGQHGALSAELMGWMEGSPRFTAFVETYRDKIRKKVRVTRDDESILDLRSELEVAYRLLADARMAVQYEPYASAGRRGPDFSVAFRANTLFNMEVARLRAGENSAARAEERISRILLNKLGQMQPSMSNLLVIHTRADLARSIDLAGVLQTLKLRVDGKDPAFYAYTHYAGPPDFYKDFLRLSGILLWSVGVSLWVNKQSHHPLDERALRAVAAVAGPPPAGKGPAGEGLAGEGPG